jgi:tRNA-guanine family transglycosylase
MLSTRIYFVEWAPNPDPFYHAPHLTPIHPKLPEGIGIPVDGYMISLQHLREGPGIKKKQAIEFREFASKVGLRKALKFKGPVFLDSGAIQFLKRQEIPPFSQLENLEYQAQFKPTYASHLDFPVPIHIKIPPDEVQKRILLTIKNAKIAKKYESCFNFKIVYVVQGRTLKDYVKASKEMATLKAEYYGVGSLVGRSAKDIIRICNIVRQHLPENAKLHAFGVTKLDAIRQLRGVVDSFDSSSGIMWGIKGVKNRSPDGGGILDWRLKPHPVGKIAFNCSCPVCRRFSTLLWENVRNLSYRTGSRRWIRYLRAIHNTFTIWKVFHQ